MRTNGRTGGRTDAQVACGVPVRDLLVPVVFTADKAAGRAALELYARRVYRTHVVDNFSWHEKTMMTGPGGVYEMLII